MHIVSSSTLLDNTIKRHCRWNLPHFFNPWSMIARTNCVCVCVCDSPQAVPLIASIVVSTQQYTKHKLLAPKQRRHFLHTRRHTESGSCALYTQKYTLRKYASTTDRTICINMICGYAAGSCDWLRFCVVFWYVIVRCDKSFK